MIIYELAVGSRCNKCRKGYIWCIDGDFMSPSEFKESGRLAYGYVLDDYTAVSLKRSALEYIWDEAKSHCTEWNNAGKYGYLPNKDELITLNRSIIYGKMKEDLIEAGLYESCNYRESSISGWNWIWSSSKYDDNNSYYVRYEGYTNYCSKYVNGYIIPFFSF